MVIGLDKFRIHFAAFTDRYVLIGGTACAILMEEVGLEFRATKDLDIVLCVEALDKEFGKAFWQFIRDGNYKYQQKSTGKRQLYRFYEPQNLGYPVMLELFSRIPDVITLEDESHLTPIPIDEDISSLSAILLKPDYYYLVHQGKREIEGLPVVGSEYLIPLKARAFLDLTERRNAGARIDEKEVRKHKNDIIRLYKLLSVSQRVTLPQSAKQDMLQFFHHVKNDTTINLKNLDLKNTTLDELINNLHQIYDLPESAH